MSAIAYAYRSTVMLRVSMTLLGAFLVASLLADSGASGADVMTGTVIEWHPDQMISIGNEQTDPGGVRIALRDTAYEGDPGAIRPGVRVTLWYRFVGESRPIAARVRLLRR